MTYNLDKNINYLDFNHVSHIGACAGIYTKCLEPFQLEQDGTIVLTLDDNNEFHLIVLHCVKNKDEVVSNAKFVLVLVKKHKNSFGKTSHLLEKCKKCDVTYLRKFVTSKFNHCDSCFPKLVEEENYRMSIRIKSNEAIIASNISIIENITPFREWLINETKLYEGYWVLMFVLKDYKQSILSHQTLTINQLNFFQMLKSYLCNGDTRHNWDELLTQFEQCLKKENNARELMIKNESNFFL